MCRVKTGVGKGQMGPKRKLPKHIEDHMLSYLRFRNEINDPIQKFIFKKEVDIFLSARNLLHFFQGNIPSKYN